MACCYISADILSMGSIKTICTAPVWSPFTEFWLKTRPVWWMCNLRLVSTDIYCCHTTSPLVPVSWSIYICKDLYEWHGVRYKICSMLVKTWSLFSFLRFNTEASSKFLLVTFKVQHSNNELKDYSNYTEFCVLWFSLRFMFFLLHLNFCQDIKRYVSGTEDATYRWVQTIHHLCEASYLW